MDDAEKAILGGRTFSIGRALRYEEPVSARAVSAGRYHVTFPAEGASNPNLVIDPPEFVVQVDLASGEITLLPDM